MISSTRRVRRTEGCRWFRHKKTLGIGARQIVEPAESAVTEAEPVAAKEAPAPITIKAEEIQQKAEVELAKAKAAMVAGKAVNCVEKLPSGS